MAERSSEASWSGRNHFRFIDPHLGIERHYASGLDEHERFMQGKPIGNPLLSALKRASMDPIVYMRNEEDKVGRAIFFNSDPTAPAEQVPKHIQARVRSLRCLTSWAQAVGCNSDEVAVIEEINARAVPYAPGSEPVSNGGRRRTRQTSRGAVSRPDVETEKDEGLEIVGADYAEAITEMAAKENAAKAAEKPAQTPEPETPPKSKTATSAPRKPVQSKPAAPAQKGKGMSLLELAKARRKA